jgi:hypothetical protein
MPAMPMHLLHGMHILGRCTERRVRIWREEPVMLVAAQEQLSSSDPVIPSFGQLSPACGKGILCLQPMESGEESMVCSHGNGNGHCAMAAKT